MPDDRGTGWFGRITNCEMRARTDTDDPMFVVRRIGPEDVGQVCVIANLDGYRITPKD